VAVRPIHARACAAGHFGVVLDSDIGRTISNGFWQSRHTNSYTGIGHLSLLDPTPPDMPATLSFEWRRILAKLGRGAAMGEIKQILCPVDMSDTSRHALEHAFAFARWYRARVTVLHVLNVPLPVMPPAGVPVVDASAPPPLRPEDVSEEVRRFIGSTSGADQNAADIVVIEGSPVREILHQAEYRRTDLLVMGTHGRSGFEALFLGAVTEKVLRSTHVPVLTVPPAVDRVEAVVYKTILCPVGFSDASIRAMEYAFMLAQETGARLIVLHVIEQLVDAPQPRTLSPQPGPVSTASRRGGSRASQIGRAGASARVVHAGRTSAVRESLSCHSRD
jgi:nucleotide-binding universal stress UspA family protein